MIISPLLTAKYAPKNLSQVFGQADAVAQLKDFVVNYKQKKNKAALLHGPIGNGKTSSVYALAQELGYDVLELNSSDFRDQESIKSFLSSALGQQSLFFTPKIVLIDEVDNISGVQDRGCIPAIISGIEKSSFPVILTANDLFEQKLKLLKKECQLIEFQKLDHKIVSHTIQWVCEQEGITFEHKAISGLARQVDGDIRAALIDLQSCSSYKKFIFDDISKLSDRKRTDTIINALFRIFKSSSVDNALGALEDIDLEYREVFLWLDENLPKEYLTAKALAKAYEHLSRADIFQGRISRQQHWRLLVYISNLLTAGISSAKEEKNTLFIKYAPTMRLLKIWQAKMKLAKKNEIVEKLAQKTHVSHKVALQQFSYLRPALATEKIAAELDLTEEERTWLDNNC
ncbi:replication factor C large subunit [Candidatus Woesearchaeota archaeon]|nr:replication factor C large subunit [Candidatus Woesearchaeota archaeon]